MSIVVIGKDCCGGDAMLVSDGVDGAGGESGMIAGSDQMSEFGDTVIELQL